jgi:olefin beta-lactone synthetase
MTPTQPDTATRFAEAPGHDAQSVAPQRTVKSVNVGAHLPRMARQHPDQPALVVTERISRSGQVTYRSLSFAELEALSNRYANGLREAGIERGARTLVMVRPGVDFVGIIFALFKLGAVPVMIDPGMGVARMLDCIRQVDLDAFVGIPLAHAMRVIRPGPFRTVRSVVTVGRRWCWGGPTLASLADRASDRFEPIDTALTDTAAILFTSGSTGPAKGVVYEHGMFDAQVRLIQAHYNIEPGEVDLPAFPLFVLFSTAMGMTAVIPDMDPSRPARVDPANIVRAIRDHKVTNTFGSPAIWHRVSSYCVNRGIRLPSLRRVLIAGAPVPRGLIERMHNVLNGDADVHTPYGATESLPVSSVSGREVVGLDVDATQGRGTCVGTVIPEIDLRFIRITDDPITTWSDDLLVADGEIGEMVVAGPVVTKEYYGLPRATALAKIIEGDRVWHRMGDVGYRDAQGRIWFCGRKSHRVVPEGGTMFTDCCEPIFNEHPDVFRSALVGVTLPSLNEPEPQASACATPNDGGTRNGTECDTGRLLTKQSPVMVIELRDGRIPKGQHRASLEAELRELARRYPTTASIERFLFHPSLPVDVRHNAKINREALAEWAGRKLS